MEENSGGFESRPPAGGRWRTVLPWLGASFAVLLALWGVSVAIEKMAGPSGGETDSPKAARATSDLETGVLAPHTASAQLDVRVLDDKGIEYPVGSPLPRKLSMTMADASGQEYQIPFDRAGVWAVAAPDATYSIPGVQKELGNWSWKLSGKGVKQDRATGSWSVAVKKGNKPTTFRLTLY